MRSQIKEKKNNSGTETNRTLRYLVSFVVIILLLAILFFWNIGVGSVEMSFFDFLGVLTKHQPDSTLYQIVWKIRLPRIIAAVLLGGALSVSGFLLQSFFQGRQRCAGRLQGLSLRLFAGRVVGIGAALDAWRWWGVMLRWMLGGGAWDD